jgi:membrane-bound serine protease (ClpP class)
MFEIANALWTVLTNPVFAYLLLMVGVFATALALSVPGTGVPEGIAFVTLALAAVGLSQLPVSVAGLALIALALVLFVLEFRLMAHGALLAGGAIAMTVGSLLLFRTAGGEAALSWVLVLGVTLSFTAFFGFLVSQGLAARKLPAAQDPDRVVGARGVARTDVNGEGAVYVAGELWSASSDAKIPANSEVVVTSREGLKLKVARTGNVNSK